MDMNLKEIMKNSEQSAKDIKIINKTQKNHNKLSGSTNHF